MCANPVSGYDIDLGLEREFSGTSHFWLASMVCRMCHKIKITPLHVSIRFCRYSATMHHDRDLDFGSSIETTG